MQQRGFSPRTQQSYLASVSRLAQCFHRSPEQISLQALQPYFNYLAQKRKLCGASCRLHLHGIRFFYLNVLQQRSFDVSLILSKCQRGIPELLTQDEVRLICLAIESEGLLVALRCFWRQCRSPGWLFPEQKPGCISLSTVPSVASARRNSGQGQRRNGVSMGCAMPMLSISCMPACEWRCLQSLCLPTPALGVSLLFSFIKRVSFG